MFKTPVTLVTGWVGRTGDELNYGIRNAKPDTFYHKEEHPDNQEQGPDHQKVVPEK